MSARAKGTTNDALPVMSASDWASFMISCTTSQLSVKSGAKVARNAYESLLMQENNLRGGQY